LTVIVYVFAVYLSPLLNISGTPVHENLVMADRPWKERYQVMSYKIISRSGDEAAFRDMVNRRNRVGIR